MTHAVDRASRWIYSGVWSFLVGVFRVPDRPPTLPVREGESIRSFQPSVGFLRWLKFYFWLVLLLIDGAILALWLVLFSEARLWAYILAIPLFLIAFVPDIFAFIAIHLRFDTTWYVMTDRSVRIRRGIWTINEVTITFENVQNVKVSQGPLQRALGIANVVIETAGSSTGESGGAVGNVGLIEGIAHADRIRDQIMRRVRKSRSAGLGDEDSREANGFSREHIEMLGQIRDLLAAT